MKSQIFGRKEGSGTAYALLIESDGASSGGRKSDPETLRQFEIASTRRAVTLLREKSIEGYVLFEGDTTRYEFTPLTDLQYPINGQFGLDEVCDMLRRVAAGPSAF